MGWLFQLAVMNGLILPTVFVLDEAVGSLRCKAHRCCFKSEVKASEYLLFFTALGLAIGNYDVRQLHSVEQNRTHR